MKTSSLDDLVNVENHLNEMGYDLLYYGAFVAQANLVSGYSIAEAAAHIALTTLARDIKEAGLDDDLLTSIFFHGMALLHILKEHKENNKIHPAQWKNDTDAIFNIITPSKYQLEWVEKILSDPISGKQRLAVNRKNYKD